MIDGSLIKIDFPKKSTETIFVYQEKKFVNRLFFEFKKKSLKKRKSSQYVIIEFISIFHGLLWRHLFVQLWCSYFGLDDPF